MVDDALAPCLARSSIATPLTMQDKQALVFYEEEFQCSAPSQRCDMAFIEPMHRNKSNTTYLHHLNVEKW